MSHIIIYPELFIPLDYTMNADKDIHNLLLHVLNLLTCFELHMPWSSYFFLHVQLFFNFLVVMKKQFCIISLSMCEIWFIQFLLKWILISFKLNISSSLLISTFLLWFNRLYPQLIFKHKTLISVLSILFICLAT